METLEKFKALGLSDNILSALKKKGFEAPSPIQEKVIPVLLDTDKDIIGQAQTGTGKTAAFGIPLIEKLKHIPGLTQALILVPTRELALQVSDEINSLKGHSSLTILPVYGGQSIEMQISHLRRGIDIVVGTPGRIMDLLRRKKLFLDKLAYLILDEADEMLNMGFVDDIEIILKETNETKQILLFSATMPAAIKKIANKYMKESVHVSVNEAQLTTSLTEQIYFEVREGDKLEALCRIIDSEHTFYSIIFCRTKLEVDRISTKLIDRGYDADALHGDISQSNREKILKKFRSKKINILVATDVAARGIDITDLTHVINYSLPQDPESYIHRIGRTGRAGKQGTAITFVSPAEYRQMSFLKRAINYDIKKKQLPDVSDIVAVKKAKIHHDIQAILESGKHRDYLALAKELSAETEPEDIIAALIQHMFEDDLKESNYAAIKESSVDSNSKTRLFVALGRMDGFNPRSLVQFLSSEGGVRPHDIQDVRISEKFSFITVPFAEAEKMVLAFKAGTKNRRRSLIERAKD